MLVQRVNSHLLIGFPVTQVWIEPVHDFLDVVVLLIDCKHEAQEIDETDSCHDTSDEQPSTQPKRHNGNFSHNGNFLFTVSSMSALSRAVKLTR